MVVGRPTLFHHIKLSNKIINKKSKFTWDLGSFLFFFRFYTRKVQHSPWKMMVGRLLSFWEGNFSGATLNFMWVWIFHPAPFLVSHPVSPTSGFPTCNCLDLDGSRTSVTWYCDNPTHYGSMNGRFTKMNLSQATIIPKPEWSGNFGGDFLTWPPFRVTDQRFGCYTLPKCPSYLVTK